MSEIIRSNFRDRIFSSESSVDMLAEAMFDFRTMLDREAETHNRCGQTEDHQEGVRAFMEKRAPQFRGR